MVSSEFLCSLVPLFVAICSGVSFGVDVLINGISGDRGLVGLVYLVFTTIIVGDRGTGGVVGGTSSGCISGGVVGVAGVSCDHLSQDTHPG